MADVGLRVSVDASSAEDGFNRLGNAAERAGQRVRSVEQQQFEEERNAQRNMPGFNEQNPARSNATVYGAAGVNENLRTFNDLGLRITELKNEIVKSSAIQKEALENGDIKKAFYASNAINQMEQEKARLEMQKKNEEESGISGQLLKALKGGQIANFAIRGVEAAGQISQINSNYRASMANGDYLGADLNRADAYAGVAQGIGGSLLGVGAMMGWNPVGWGLMAAGGLLEVGGIVTKAITGAERADDAEANAFERGITYLNGLNKLYNNGGSAESHARQTDDLRVKAEGLSKDTGLATSDFLSLASKQSAFGTRSVDEAMQQARQAALWANSTGADVSSIQNFIGTASRYGINSDTGYLSQARNAMGLQKAQTQEFLNSLQSVISDGISNGYIKSTEDVTKTFTMFAKLSNNNQLWIGEQGAKRLQSLNAGIAGATALNDVSQIMTVNVAKNIVNGMNEEQWNKAFGGMYNRSGTYIDYMLMTEKGLTPQMFAGIGKSINEFEGNNYAGRIERWKQISGLNYAGAVALDQMYRNATPEQLKDDKWISDKISLMQKDSNYISEETQKANLINKLDSYIQTIGESKYWENLNELAEKGKEYYSKALYTGNQSMIDKSADEQGLYQKLVDDEMGEPFYDYTGVYGKVKGNDNIMLTGGRTENKFTTDFLKFLLKSEEGNNVYDNIIKREVGKEAMKGGMVKSDEIKLLLEKLVNNKDFASAYMGMDETKLRNVIQTAFSNALNGATFYSQ